MPQRLSLDNYNKPTHYTYFHSPLWIAMTKGSNSETTTEDGDKVSGGKFTAIAYRGPEKDKSLKNTRKYRKYVNRLTDRKLNDLTAQLNEGRDLANILHKGITQAQGSNKKDG